jgi:hypothetical protein
MECWNGGEQENRKRIQGNHENTKVGKHEKRNNRKKSLFNKKPRFSGAFC